MLIVVWKFVPIYDGYRVEKIFVIIYVIDPTCINLFYAIRFIVPPFTSMSMPSKGIFTLLFYGSQLTS